MFVRVCVRVVVVERVCVLVCTFEDNEVVR